MFRIYIRDVDDLRSQFRMKQRVPDENLYYVDKILKLEEKDGQLYAVIKWENYSYREVTRERVESLKLNPTLRADLSKKEAEFKTLPFTKAIEHQLSDYLTQLSRVHYGAQSKKSHIKSPQKIEGQQMVEEAQQKAEKESQKKEKTLAPQQLALCIQQAEKIMAKRISYGLGSLEPLDYFKLEDILEDAVQQLKKPKANKEIMRQLAVQEIKGVCRQNEEYKFCIVVKGKVFTANTKKVLELFPHHLYNFLTKFLRYMKQHMKKEIQRQETLIINKRLKVKSIEAVSKMLNITQHMQSHNKAVHFGLDYEDMLNNVYEHKLTFLKPDNSQQQEKDLDNVSVASKQSKKKAKNKGKEDRVGLAMAGDLKSLYMSVNNDILRRLAGDISGSQISRKSSRSKKAISYIEISSGRSASRSRSKGRHEHVDDSNDQVSVHSRSLSNRTPASKPEKQSINKNNSSTPLVRADRRSSVSDEISGQEEQMPQSHLKRAPEDGEDVPCSKKRFKR